MRLRTFIMKDAYTFDIDRAGLDKAFLDQRDAYQRIFATMRHRVLNRRGLVRMQWADRNRMNSWPGPMPAKI